MTRLLTVLAALLLTACGRGGPEAGSGDGADAQNPEAAMAAGIEASVKDVAAARQASATPLPAAEPTPAP